VQLGEDPAHIHVVGSPALDTIKSLPPIDRSALFAAVGLEPRPRLLLMAFHPATLDRVGSRWQLEELLALDGEDDNTAMLITGSNADTAGRAFSARLAQYARAAPGRA
jgi:UDP-N-acetylglucosamine 2-epimerase